MKPEQVSIESVLTNDDNPRFIRDEKFEKLVQSIKEFPEMMEVRPIVVNADMVALGGNMRLLACRKAGLKKVWIIKAENFTEEQQREFIIKDNVGFGEWDFDILANEWEGTDLEKWGLDVWQPSDVNLDDFFEEGEEIKETNNTKIVLEYSEADFQKVNAAFDKLDGSKENIVWNLLGL